MLAASRVPYVHTDRLKASAFAAICPNCQEGLHVSIVADIPISGKSNEMHLPEQGCEVAEGPDSDLPDLEDVPVTYYQRVARSDGCRARWIGWTGGLVGSDSDSDWDLPDLEGLDVPVSENGDVEH